VFLILIHIQISLQKLGKSMSHAKWHHLTVYLTMWRACIDCMCHALIRRYCKHDVLLYSQFNDGTSGGNIKLCSVIYFFAYEGCCTGGILLSISGAVLRMCIVTEIGVVMVQCFQQ